jgi:uncharacterized protein
MKEVHTITHIEIPAPDLEKAIAFYASLFNWEIDIQPGGNYAYFRITGTASGGGFDANLQPAAGTSGVRVTIDVEDVDEKLKEIEGNGGKITLGKTQIPGGHGYYASFLDPNGNIMQLHSST